MYFFLSVEGFSLKFEVLNITGFTFYSIYNCMSYFGKYEGAGNVDYLNHFIEINNLFFQKVDVTDVTFSLHALLMVLIQAVQCLIYPVILYFICKIFLII